MNPNYYNACMCVSVYERYSVFWGGNNLTESGLTLDGLALALIGSVLALIMVGLNFFTSESTIVNFSGTESLLGSGMLATVIILALIFVLYFIAEQRIDIGEPIILGIIVLVIALLIGGIGGLFAAFGGVLIILDAIFTGAN